MAYDPRHEEYEWVEGEYPQKREPVVEGGGGNEGWWFFVGVMLFMAAMALIGR